MAYTFEHLDKRGVLASIHHLAHSFQCYKLVHPLQRTKGCGLRDEPWNNPTIMGKSWILPVISLHKSKSLIYVYNFKFFPFFEILQVTFLGYQGINLFQIDVNHLKIVLSIVSIRIALIIDLFGEKTKFFSTNSWTWYNLPIVPFTQNV